MKMQNSIKSVSAAKRKEQKQTLEFQRIILTVGNSVMENKDDLCPHYTMKVVVFESDIVISTSIHTM